MKMLQSLNTTYLAIAAVLALVVLAGQAWIIRKRALLAVQDTALDQYKKALESANARIDSLERDTQLQSARIDHLERVIAEKDRAIKAIFDEIATTDRCMNASTCDNRQIPGGKSA